MNLQIHKTVPTPPLTNTLKSIQTGKTCGQAIHLNRGDIEGRPTFYLPLLHAQMGTRHTHTEAQKNTVTNSKILFGPLEDGDLNEGGSTHTKYTGKQENTRGSRTLTRDRDTHIHRKPHI
jgi:hypothetical protein